MTHRIRRRSLCVPAFLLVIAVLAGCSEMAAINDLAIEHDPVLAAPTTPVALCASDGLGHTVFTPVAGVDLAMLFAAVEIAFAEPEGGDQYYFATADNVPMP